MKRLKLLIPPLPWQRARHRDGVGDRVVLLHGLWRSFWSMEDLAKAVHQEGFETLNLPYPSFRKTLSQIVDHLAEALSGSEKTTHFITHSMGGIALRCLAHRHPELVTGKIIMLAPPNQGSEIIDWLQDCPIARFSLGPAGMNLTTQRVRQEIPVLSDSLDLSVIMGNRQNLPFFHSLLQGEHDGVVTATGGRLSSQTHLEVMDADHSFIMGEKMILNRVCELLNEWKNGKKSTSG